MNTNLIHNFLNFLIFALAAVTSFMLTSGCVETATGAMNCTSSTINQFVSPATMASVIAGLGLLKSMINFLRDGLAGFYKPQPKID